MTEKKHQIRLSGCPEFQRRLRETRGRLYMLSAEFGSPAAVAGLALRNSDPKRVKAILDKECCLFDGEHAKSPDTVTITVRDEDVDALNDMRGQLVAIGCADASLRTALHGAICAYAELTDKEIKQSLPQ